MYVYCIIISKQANWHVVNSYVQNFICDVIADCFNELGVLIESKIPGFANVIA